MSTKSISLNQNHGSAYQDARQTTANDLLSGLLPSLRKPKIARRGSPDPRLRSGSGDWGLRALTRAVFELLPSLLIVIVIIVLLLSQERPGVGLAP